MINQIVTKINLQNEIAVEALKMDAVLNYKELQPYLSMLNSEDTWEEGEKRLKDKLGEDPLGIKILTVMLHCGQKVHETYTELGIDELIYTDTMKCFTRFLKEHKENYGFYKFDRSFWTSRQVSMHLFRIGELEYELDHKNGQKIVSIHIPSDADLAGTKVRESLQAAKSFLEKLYPDYSKVDIMCESWLLSPSLKKILPDTSKIIHFQNSFIIVDIDLESEEYLEWVYKLKPDTMNIYDYKEFPENTSLQRNMKQYLIDGGKIGMATGVLLSFENCL